MSHKAHIKTVVPRDVLYSMVNVDLAIAGCMEMILYSILQTFNYLMDLQKALLHIKC